MKGLKTYFYLGIGQFWSQPKDFCCDLKCGHDRCDAPKLGGPLTTRQPAEYKWMSGYPTPLQKIGQSLLCTGSSTQIQYLYKPAFTCPKQSNICNTTTWAHKLILIKTNITTILQLSPNNSIVDYTFIRTYINIYKSNTCYVQKPSKS